MTTRIGLIGASGETGRSIVDGLLDAAGFTIIALTRPASISKPANAALQDRGVDIRPFDLRSGQEALVAALKDLDILISAIAGFEQLEQIPLATAAKTAGIKRFLPCAFIPCIPSGIHLLCDQKQQVYDHIFQLKLPYTIVDVGWWYQTAYSFPRLPSGKIDYAILLPDTKIP